MSYKNSAFRVSFAGIMFGLVLLFQFLERFMLLGMGYVKLNISIIFILVTYFVAGLRYAILLFMLRFAFGPAVGSSGYSDVGVGSHFILLVYGLLFFTFFALAHKGTNHLLVSILFASLTVSLFSGLLNGLLFNPVYWAIGKRGYGLPISLTEAKQTYFYIKDLAFLGIDNYWGGMFAVYPLVNIIKFVIVSFILYSVLQVLIHTPYKSYIVKSGTIKVLNLRMKRNL